jgi:hypothetical protein
MSTIVIKMLPGQRKKPPSLLYPPATHAVCDRANGNTQTILCFMNLQTLSAHHPCVRFWFAIDWMKGRGQDVCHGSFSEDTNAGLGLS